MLEEQAEELALIESRENGKSVQDARQNDINFLIAIFRFFGGLIASSRSVSSTAAWPSDGGTAWSCAGQRL